MTTNATNPIGVIGAGTMGAGIAQAAAAAGWNVRLFDVESSLVNQAKENITTISPPNHAMEKARSILSIEIFIE